MREGASGTLGITGNGEIRRRRLAAPASDSRGLGARFELKEEGKWREGAGLLIESKMAGINGH